MIGREDERSTDVMVVYDFRSNGMNLIYLPAFDLFALSTPGSLFGLDDMIDV